MCIKQGFTIIEWLVSFCVTVLLVTLVFQFLANIYTAYVQRATYNNVFAQNTIALDHISRNISCATSQKKDWHVLSDTHILWHDEQNKRDIGYLFDKKNIYFLVRVKKKKKISKIRKNLLASNVKSVTFTPVIKQDNKYSIKSIHSIECSITFGTEDNTCCFDRVISLKNRVLR